MVKKYCYIESLTEIFWGREDNIMVRHEVFFKPAFLGHVLNKISAFVFWCTVIPLGSRSVYT